MSCHRDGSVIYIYAQKNKSKASELLMYIHTYTSFSTKACTPCFTCIEDILLSIPLYELPLVRQQVFTGNEMQNCSGNHQKHYTQKSNKKKKNIIKLL